MMQPILSLCIPTNGIVEYVRPLVKSIYEQEVDDNLFEVVISDNGKNIDLMDKLNDFPHTNLRYIKNTESGFLNQVSCLKASKGLFAKLVNHKSILVEGSLARIIDFIRQNIETRPLLFFSNGQLGKFSIYKCTDFDTFLKKISFWASWEEGLGIWHEALPQLDNIEYNSMFPAASILFGLRTSQDYIVYNVKNTCQPNNLVRVRKYDFFHVFAVDWVAMYRRLLENARISCATYRFLKYDLFRRYLISYYYQIVVAQTDKTAVLNNIKKSMSVNYTYFHYLWMVFYANIILRLKNLSMNIMLVSWWKRMREKQSIT